MFFNSFKIVLTLCLTFVTVAVLIISYGEYTNRYELIGSSDQSLYIFDKKTTVLNKCTDKGCEIIDTKLPEIADSVTTPISNISNAIFGNKDSTKKTMVEEIVSKPEPEATEPTAEPAKEEGVLTTDSDSSKPGEKKEQTEKNSSSEQVSEDDEFVEE